MTDQRSVLQVPSNGFWAGIVAGLLILSVMMAFDLQIRKEPPAPRPILASVAAAESLVRDWERMRNGTWAVDSTYVRTLADGRSFNGSVREAQRPPDHIRVGLDSIDARVNGRKYVCGPAPGRDTPVCRDGGTAEDYRTIAEREVDAIRATVIGTNRLYDVAEDGAGCYRLFHRPARIISSWGEQVRFCFDPSTGAPTLSEFNRERNVDRIRSITVRPQPADGDFELPK